MKKQIMQKKQNNISKRNIVQKIDNIFILLKDYIDSFDFLNTYREKKNDFIRKCKLPFVKLITFILNFRYKSTQAELNEFFEHGCEEKQKTPKKSTFFKARLKIKAEAFLNLLEKSCNFFYQTPILVKKWLNFRLIAVDTSTFTIPLTGKKELDEELIDYFGVAKNRFPNMKVIQSKGQILYDPLNQLIISGTLTSYPVNERLILSEELNRLKKDDLLLLDRGYPAVWLFGLFHLKDIKFVARLSKSFLPETACFFISEEEDKIITIKITPKIAAKYPEIELPIGKIKIRLVKVILDSGEVEVLATSLLDKKQFPIYIFQELYFKRWPIEGTFDSLKNKLQIEWFSGKRIKIILQDFYAKLFQRNLYSLIELRASFELKEKNEELKYKYEINENIAYSILKNKWVKLIIKSIDKIIEILNKIVKEIVRFIEPFRPGRQYIRNKKNKSKSTMIAFANRIAI